MNASSVGTLVERASPFVTLVKMGSASALARSERLCILNSIMPKNGSAEPMIKARKWQITKNSEKHRHQSLLR